MRGGDRVELFAGGADREALEHRGIADNSRDSREFGAGIGARGLGAVDEPLDIFRRDVSDFFAQGFLGYRREIRERVGEVFSDPPMNMAAGVVSAGDAMIAGDVRLPLTDHLSGLGEGAYTFGVRANHLSLSRAAAEDIEIQGTVDLAEVSGSETFVHVVHGNTSLVVQEEGVHSLGIGKEIRVYLDPDHLFAFDGVGRLVASPRGATGRV